ncbi:hypothetical protein V2O64_07375 [Verrucomicrobiaceae bacterium 227]
MKAYIKIIILSLLATCCALADEGEKPKAQVVAVRGKIEVLVKLLEKGHEREFLEAAVDPVEKVAKSIVIDESFVKEFKDRKSKKILILLKEIVGKDASNVTKTTVSYELKRGGYCNFKLHKGVWYLSNDNDNDKPAK